jgi:hypothetical protein
MSIAKVTEIIASSDKSFEEAIEQGIAKASATISGITGAWVGSQKVLVNDGEITEYRVDLKITFVLK